MAIKNKFINQSNNLDYGHKNLVLNGSFDIWQRGTSFTNCGGSTKYTADRWGAGRTGWATGCNVSKQTQGLYNVMRVQRNAGDTNTTATISCGTTFEANDTKKWAGRTVTVQFKVAKGSNFSATNNYLQVSILTGTGSEIGFGDGMAGITYVLNQQVAITSTFTQYTFTATLPNAANPQMTLYFAYTPTGTAGANDYFELGEVQMELGSFATSIERRPYGVELALCKRYFERLTYINGTAIATLHCFGATTAYGPFSWTVEKRVAPSISYTGTINALASTGGNAGGTATFTYAAASTNAVRMDIGGASGLVVGNATTAYANGSNVYIDINAEM